MQFPYPLVRFLSIFTHGRSFQTHAKCMFTAKTSLMKDGWYAAAASASSSDIAFIRARERNIRHTPGQYERFPIEFSLASSLAHTYGLYILTPGIA